VCSDNRDYHDENSGKLEHNVKDKAISTGKAPGTAPGSKAAVGSVLMPPNEAPRPREVSAA
jgi:hypothetical protein